MHYIYFVELVVEEKKNCLHFLSGDTKRPDLLRVENSLCLTKFKERKLNLGNKKRSWMIKMKGDVGAQNTG